MIEEIVEHGGRLGRRWGGRGALRGQGGQQPLQMRLPKFGFNSAKARITAEVTLSEVASVEADVIDLQTLIDADLLKGTMKRAKVILSGKIERAVNLKGIRATKGARAAIEAAGGSIEE